MLYLIGWGSLVPVVPVGRGKVEKIITNQLIIGKNRLLVLVNIDF
ncbi:hypothetical protein [Okeania sp.]|nr:hypothetical protein [Okeania sp.]MEB3341030.1 hypothetical protein [Okeania sp.]